MPCAALQAADMSRRCQKMKLLSPANIAKAMVHRVLSELGVCLPIDAIELLASFTDNRCVPATPPRNVKASWLDFCRETLRGEHSHVQQQAPCTGSLRLHYCQALAGRAYTMGASSTRLLIRTS